MSWIFVSSFLLVGVVDIMVDAGFERPINDVKDLLLDVEHEESTISSCSKEQTVVRRDGHIGNRRVVGTKLLNFPVTDVKRQHADHSLI